MDEAATATSLSSELTRIANQESEEAKATATDASNKLDDLSAQAGC
jgi:hypothetical protein